ERPPAAAALVVAGPELCDPVVLDGLLDRFAAGQACGDKRAAASQWSKYFFSRLIIAATVVQLAEDRALDLAIERLRLGFDAHGFTQTIAPDTPAPLTTAPGHDFSRLVERTLAPVVRALAGRCRLAPRVFWSNAAVYYDYALGELAAQRRIAPGRIHAAGKMLTAPRLAGGARNPFYRPYRTLAPGAIDGNGQPATRCRRLCCMRDLDPRWSLCPDCPRAYGNRS
ncbi:siderophore-iron reductase FhuF, partial [Salinisphaera sp.]|uniref:siderophore-iron reductase FhuF n=1 Tax=Salinisphaera sp. TaxID=1914330 RepID=UPI002D77AF34